MDSTGTFQWPTGAVAHWPSDHICPRQVQAQALGGAPPVQLTDLVAELGAVLRGELALPDPVHRPLLLSLQLLGQEGQEGQGLEGERGAARKGGAAEEGAPREGGAAEEGAPREGGAARKEGATEEGAPREVGATKERAAAG